MLREITRFVNWLRRRNPTADTAKSYHYHLRKFTQVVGDCLPRTVTLRDIDNFIEFQALLGHKRLNTTMTYARVHDKTVIGHQPRHIWKTNSQ